MSINQQIKQPHSNNQFLQMKKTQINQPERIQPEMFFENEMNIVYENDYTKQMNEFNEFNNILLLSNYHDLHKLFSTSKYVPGLHSVHFPFSK